jgi:hypothetical protein
MITEAQYKEANRAGLSHRATGDMWSYYTPTLQIAYNLGWAGVSIQDVQPLTAFRFGKAPANFVSYNHRENCTEKGLSVYTEGSTVRGEFEGRIRYEYTGLPVATGGDGEMLILAFDAENLD